jgi:hypothetical protein
MASTVPIINAAIILLRMSFLLGVPCGEHIAASGVRDLRAAAASTCRRPLAAGACARNAVV